MKIDALAADEMGRIGEFAARAESLGCDGILVPEVAHDPFLSLSIAAEHTGNIRLTTGVAVAFARNPMSIAVAASDLQRFSQGRFSLGLGSQIAAHITRRFSMEWSHPARRMREFVSAVRAIWSAWESQTPLDFHGDFYQHTLMTPVFDHGPSPYGWPPIHIAAVGPLMARTAGEVADGLMCHGFTTAEYLQEVTVPNLERGLERAGRSRNDVEVSVPVHYTIVDDESDLETARTTIAFYGSTPAYRPVLEHHGWGELGDELHRLSREGKWSSMSPLIDDEVLNAFCAVGTASEVLGTIGRRFGNTVDRLEIGIPRDDHARDFIAALSAGSLDSMVRSNSESTHD